MVYIYIWLIFMANVGIYTTHGSYGEKKVTCPNRDFLNPVNLNHLGHPFFVNQKSII